MNTFDIWKKQLGPRKAVAFALLLSLLLAVSVGIVAIRYYASFLDRQAVSVFDKAKSLPGSLVFDRAKYLRKSLLLSKRAMALNPIDASYFYHYSQTLEYILFEDNLRQIITPAQAGFESNVSSSWDELVVRSYKKTIRLEPENYLYHFRLGVIFRRLGAHQSAEEEFVRAVKLDPQNLTQRVYVAKYYLERGDWRAAFCHLGRSAFLNKYVFNLVEPYLFDGLRDSISEQEIFGIFRKGRRIIMRFEDIPSIEGIRLDFPFGVRICLSGQGMQGTVDLKMELFLPEERKILPVPLLSQEWSPDGFICATQDISRYLSGCKDALSQCQAAEIKRVISSSREKVLIKYIEVFIDS